MLYHNLKEKTLIGVTFDMSKAIITEGYPKVLLFIKYLIWLIGLPPSFCALVIKLVKKNKLKEQDKCVAIEL